MAEEQTYTAEWEMVNSTGSNIRQFRQKVPGGWLVVCSMDESTASTFIADAGHTWDPPIKQGRKKGGGFY